MAAVIGLLIIVLLSVVVTRVATVMLTLTGLSPEIARFQARSAFTTTGYSSKETEAIVNHPVRRRIVYTTMMVGNVGLVGVIATTVSSFTEHDNDLYSTGAKLGILAAGLALLLAVSMSRWIDDQLFKCIGWALKRWTVDEIHDYQNLLHLGHGYSVTELPIEAGNWPIGKRLDELRLSHIGVNVLGIHRRNGKFVGSPVGATYVRNGDSLVVYGARKDITRFNDSRGESNAAEVFQHLLDARAPEIATAQAKRMETERRRIARKHQRDT